MMRLRWERGGGNNFSFRTAGRKKRGREGKESEGMGKERKGKERDGKESNGNEGCFLAHRFRLLSTSAPFLLLLHRSRKPFTVYLPTLQIGETHEAAASEYTHTHTRVCLCTHTHTHTLHAHVCVCVRCAFGHG